MSHPAMQTQPQAGMSPEKELTDSERLKKVNDGVNLILLGLIGELVSVVLPFLSDVIFQII